MAAYRIFFLKVSGVKRYAAFFITILWGYPSFAGSDEDTVD